MGFGFGSSISRYNGQHYESLKKECRESGVPFSDPTFPADDSSLFYTINQQLELPGRVEWKRPKDISENPKLFVDGASSCDVVQGKLGNCWLVAATSALAQEKELWNKVIPDHAEQEWNDRDPDSYAGIFHFRFWRFGEWLDVVIDDRLPTIHGELVYLHSRQKNEFWGPLLEKAYAKVAGTYAALDGGNLSDALVDFSGGIAEILELDAAYANNEDKRRELFKKMATEVDAHSLMCAAIKAEGQNQMEQVTPSGLVKGHAYGITSVKKVYVGNISLFKGREKVYMVRLRNPWGGKEWNGPFSDGSEEWSRITESERERIGLTFSEDGEFWMPIEEFCNHFTDLSLCYMINTSWFSFGKTWSEASFLGNWIPGRSGGCLNHGTSFLHNPQYSFDVEGDDDQPVLVYLLQKDTRAQRKEGIQNLVIGFHIMKVEENRKYRLHVIREAADTSPYVRTRGVYLNTSFKRGRYVLIPTTFEPDQLGQFYLRIFTSKSSYARELVDDVPRHGFCSCLSYPSVVSLVTVRNATGLEKQDRFGSANPYCIVKCEGSSVRGPICKNNLDPRWDFSAIFYRNKVSNPIKVQIWNSNIVMDSYMGRAVFNAPLNPQPVIHEAELYGRRREKNNKRPGKIVVEITTCDDLARF